MCSGESGGADSGTADVGEAVVVADIVSSLEVWFVFQI
jgi:hypothetical protein